MIIDPKNIVAADTVWVLVASALVMFMTPGLALFYGGMVRTKNVLAMLMQNFFSLGLISVLWAVLGYSLAFGGTNGFFGNLDFLGLNDTLTTAPPGLALTIPPLVFVIFQMTFAVITPALITGAIADRMRFAAWVWFLGLWSLLVYSPVAHWVWAPSGWLFKLGALDFAGGTVVHINAGIAALVVTIFLGKRRGWPKTPMPPHNLTLTLIGTGILWFGWFGFNAGSSLAANGLAAQAFMNTHLAAAAAMLSWLAVEKWKQGHATTLGAASGAVAGLVAITPCAGYVQGMSPIYIGLIAGVACFFAVSLKFKFGFDDSLDVIGVHLVGGLAGAILVGVFAEKAVNSAGADGILSGGGATLLGKQAIASAGTLAYSAVITAIICIVLKKFLPGGLRVTDEQENAGLDQALHSESGYSLDRV
ncbi:MAG: ammonium transporter [Acidimicrobiia bacterium]